MITTEELFASCQGKDPYDQQDLLYLELNVVGNKKMAKSVKCTVYLIHKR